MSLSAIFMAIRIKFAAEIKVTLPKQENVIPMERTTSKRDKPLTLHGEWQTIKKAYWYTVSCQQNQYRVKSHGRGSRPHAVSYFFAIGFFPEVGLRIHANLFPPYILSFVSICSITRVILTATVQPMPFDFSSKFYLINLSGLIDLFTSPFFSDIYQW